MRKILLCSFAMFFAQGYTTAAEVSWNLFSARVFEDSYFDWRGVRMYYYGDIQPEISLIYNFSDGMLSSIKFGGVVNVGVNAVIWIDAEREDLLSDDYFRSHFASGDRVYSDNYYTDEWTMTDYTREVSEGETLYIAFEGLGLTDKSYYGWLELLVEDDGLSLVTSALTYSQGLIVGTGDFAAIPEPSAGILLLLGLAGLTLRRRTKKRRPWNSIDAGR